MSEGLTYEDAGVDIQAGDRLVDRIKPLAAATRTADVLGGVGGFAGLCRVPPGLDEPVLVSGTDGVGTKLRVAFLANKHDTVGIDLVAMCVNDVITVGARPLFFLDYYATGKLDVDVAAAVVAGVAEGCKQAECALLGGETAEMPGSYPEGEYDLAGFSVGVVERARILDGSQVEPSDALIALPSSGLHSNGFSLARKILFERAGHAVHDHVEGLGGTLADVLLTPTRIYARAARAALEVGGVRAICHVTGGGLPGNLPRVLPAGLGAHVNAAAVPALPIFRYLQEQGSVSDEQMRSTFNLGVGLVLAVGVDQLTAVMDALSAAGESPFVLGEVAPVAEGEARVRYVG